MIGVFAIDVDTAGSSHKEGEIKAISHSLALELKAKLLDNSKRKSSPKYSESKPKTSKNLSPFIKISLLSLVKVGITSNYIRSFWLLLFFFFTISENITRFTGKDIYHNKDIRQLCQAEIL